MCFNCFLKKSLFSLSHQVVALLAEGVHVRVGHAQPRLEVELVAAPENSNYNL